MGYLAYVYCDKCGVKYENRVRYPKKELVRHMRREGWSIGNYDLCPDCKIKWKKNRR
jgi:NAD-dependent SIR2 family protein deacetylase